MDENFMHDELQKSEDKYDDNTVDYKERYGTLRNKINEGKETFKKQIIELKDAIEKRKEELELFKLKLHKLEGAVEVSDLYLKEVLATPKTN